MVQAHGVLSDEVVVVTEEPEADRLWQRGSYGERDKVTLQLDLLEAAYLVEEGRLEVRDADGATVDHDRLVALGARALERFETRYLVYRDHRARGFVVRGASGAELDAWTRGASPPRQRASILVAARAEADTATPSSLHALVAEGERSNRQVLLGVVDEESDVTYYELARATVHGDLPDPAAKLAPDARAVLLADRSLVVEDPGLAEGGYGNEAGGQRFLSLAETHHLVGYGLALETLQGQAADQATVAERARAVHAEADQAIAAYTWLRAHDLVPKTGFKFGVQYRVYRGLPGEGHAPLLVHALQPEAAWSYQDLARFVRLAHSVRKRPVLWSGGRGVVVTWVRP